MAVKSIVQIHIKNRKKRLRKIQKVMRVSVKESV